MPTGRKTCLQMQWRVVTRWGRRPPRTCRRSCTPRPRRMLRNRCRQRRRKRPLLLRLHLRVLRGGGSNFQVLMAICLSVSETLHSDVKAKHFRHCDYLGCIKRLVVSPDTFDGKLICLTCVCVRPSPRVWSCKRI